MHEAQTEYTVDLDQFFHGPLDLLLHLLREQEVEIHEIEISLVVDGYLAYLQNMQELDIELAGEFLVMASTLMAIKARSLLPREEVNLEEELDPRDELIARLIEYRRFKGAAGDLAERYYERQRLHPRGYREDTLKGTIERTIDLGDLTHWDLLTSYSRLMRETLQHRPERVINEARPMRYFVNRLASRMRDLRQTTLRELLDDLRSAGEPANRETVIGSFCALLELIKIGVVRVRQAEGETDISIDLSDEVDSDVEDLVRASRFDDEDLEKEAQDAPENSTPEQPAEKQADHQAPQPDLN